MENLINKIESLPAKEKEKCVKLVNSVTTKKKETIKSKTLIIRPEVTKHTSKMKMRKLVKETLKRDKLFNSVKRMSKKQRYNIYRMSEAAIIKQLKEKQSK